MSSSLALPGVQPGASSCARLRHAVIAAAAALALLLSAGAATAQAWRLTIEVHGGGLVEETQNPEASRQKCGSTASTLSDDSSITCVSADIYCGLCNYTLKATAATGFAFSRYEWVRPTDIGSSGTTSSWTWAAGNAGDFTVRVYFVDTTPPDTTVTGGPPEASVTAGKTASFTLGTTQPGGVGTYACTLNGGSIPCGPALNLTALADGPKTLKVAARDPSGNLDATPVTRTWTVDSIPPVTTLSGGPVEGSRTNSRSATFGIDVADATATSRTCKLDNVAIGCAGGTIALSSLPDGPHTLTASATDAAGNPGATASRKWTVDTDAPTTTLAGGPANGTVSASTTAAFTIGSDEPGTASCTLDGTSVGCKLGDLTLTGLKDGAHTLTVRARDTAGNEDPAGVTRSWRVDTAPPVAITPVVPIVAPAVPVATNPVAAPLAAPAPIGRISITATVSWASVSRKGLKLRGVNVVDAPKGAVVEVSCPGKKKCPFAQKKVSTGKRVTLAKFAGKTLAPGASIAIKVTVAGMIGDYVVKRVNRPGVGRKGLEKFAKQPLTTVRQCVPAGASAPARSC